MNLDTYLDHGEDEVKRAIVQFAARRSYRLREAWYLQGLRIELPTGKSSGERRGRIDIELRRKRGKTRLRITVGRGHQSTKLAYDLQSYLQDDRAYHAQCPPMCPKCGRPVPNLHARFCGRCGRKLITGEVEEPRPVAVQARAAPPPVPQVRPLPEPVVVERDPAPEPAAAIVQTEAPVVEKPEIAPAGNEKDAIDAPEEAPAEAEIVAEVEFEAESDHPDENRPRRALAED